MYKKDYIAIADCLRSAQSPTDVDVFIPTGEEMRQDIIGRLSRVFAADNPQFNRTQFQAACK